VLLIRRYVTWNPPFAAIPLSGTGRVGILLQSCVVGSFLSDIEPLIAPDTVWSFEAAAGYVQHEILPLLPGKSWRGDE